MDLYREIADLILELTINKNYDGYGLIWTLSLSHAKQIPYHWATKAIGKQDPKILFISIHVYARSQMNSLTAILTATVRI